MYKLSLKLSPLGIVAPLIFAAAAIMLPQQPMLAGGNSFHISVLFVVLIGVALIGSLIMFDRASKVQKYQAALSIFAFSSLYGVLGNLFYNFWKFSPGMMVEFSYAQLAIMCLGGLGTTFALFKLEPFDSFASGGLERLQKSKSSESGPQETVAAAPTIPSALESAESAEDFMKSKGSLRGLTSSKTDMQAHVPPAETVTNRKTPSSVESAQAIMTPPVEIDLDASDEMLSGPLNPSPSAPAARTGAGAGAGAGTGAGAAGGPTDAKNSATSNRLQAQKRRNTSTFTKLQALSASGTGSLKPTPVQDTTGGGDLRSLLDRLDTEEDSTDYEALPKPEEIRIAVLFSEVAEKPKTGEPAKPQPAASKPQPLAQPARPAPKDGPARPTTTQSTPARPMPATPGGGKDEKPVGGLAAKMAEKRQAPPGPAGNSPDLLSLLDRAEALSDDEEKSEVPQVQEFEAAPSKSEKPAQAASPAESKAASTDDAGGLLARRFMEMSEDEDEEPASPAFNDSLTVSGLEADIEPRDEEREEEKVFPESVDDEIDDIFTLLAPAESQKEVTHEAEEETTSEEEASPAAPKEEESLPEPEAEEQPESKQPETEPEAEPSEDEEAESETLFGESVDGDVDDLFSNLAPAEAQLNVGDRPFKSQTQDADEEPSEEASPAADQIDQEATGDFSMPQADAEPAEEEESAEEEEGDALFSLGDSDVDDIFAGIAGEQLDVNAETLKKVKEGEKPEPPMPTSLVETGDRIPVISAEPKSAKQTGDMPAMSKEQAAKVKDEIAKQAAEDEDSEEEESVEAEAAPMSPEKAKLKKELKEFGTLSARSAKAPKAQGESVGTMKTIGKLLIDNQAIENIIKAGEQRKLGQNLSTARIISSARGQGIMELLHKIDKYEGVFGSIIVGHDGLVMASTLKDGWDKDIMGALSTALLSTSNLTTKKLEIGKLRQMVMLTKDGDKEKTTILTDVDVGILAVFVEETDISKIDGMLDTIHKTIHG